MPTTKVSEIRQFSRGSQLPLDLSVFEGYTEEVAVRDAEIRARRRETERRREEEIESEPLRLKLLYDPRKIEANAKRIMKSALFTAAKNSFFMRATQLAKPGYASEEVRARIHSRRSRFPLRSDIMESLPPEPTAEQTGEMEAVSTTANRRYQQLPVAPPSRIVASLVAKEPRLHSMKMSVHLLNALADHEDDVDCLKQSYIRRNQERREAEDLACEQANITAQQRADREATMESIRVKSRQHVSEVAVSALRKIEASQIEQEGEGEGGIGVGFRPSNDNAKTLHRVRTKSPSPPPLVTVLKDSEPPKEPAWDHQRMDAMESKLSSLEELVFSAARTSTISHEALTKAGAHGNLLGELSKDRGSLKQEAKELAYPQAKVAGDVLSATRSRRVLQGSVRVDE